MYVNTSGRSISLAAAEARAASKAPTIKFSPGRFIDRNQCACTRGPESRRADYHNASRQHAPRAHCRTTRKRARGARSIIGREPAVNVDA